MHTETMGPVRVSAAFETSLLHITKPVCWFNVPSAPNVFGKSVLTRRLAFLHQAAIKHIKKSRSHIAVFKMCCHSMRWYITYLWVPSPALTITRLYLYKMTENRLHRFETLCICVLVGVWSYTSQVHKLHAISNVSCICWMFFDWTYLNNNIKSKLERGKEKVVTWLFFLFLWFQRQHDLLPFSPQKHVVHGRMNGVFTLPFNRSGPLFKIAKMIKLAPIGMRRQKYRHNYKYMYTPTVLPKLIHNFACQTAAYLHLDHV